MKWWILSHVMSYFSENFFCLTYGFDLLASKYMLFASYLDLITDISEAFGVWVALVVLLLSATTAMVVIQQTITYSFNSLTKSAPNSSNKSVSLVEYRYFLNFISKKLL